MEEPVTETQHVPDVTVMTSRCWFLETTARELKVIFRLAWPTSLSILFHYLLQPMSLMFCGRLGKVELASAAMALSVIYIFVVSIGRGLAFGGDTFFSQTYGSVNKKGVGVYLQKVLLFGVLCSLVICGFLLNTRHILILFHQDPQVARLAQTYTQTFMPGVLAYCWSFTLMRYLLCQNRVLPNLTICAVCCGVNGLLHYLLVDRAGLGLRGSAISLAVTYYVVLLLLLCYIYISQIYIETWDGWSWQCLDDWGSFSKVAVPSIVMTFIFWLSTEVGTFFSGLLGTDEISAFSICFQVEGLAWVIPLGVGSACTTRVGQCLGGLEPRRATVACRVAFAIQAVFSILLAVVCCSLRFYIPTAFTKDTALITLTASLLPYVSVFLLLEGSGGIGVSVIRGTGRQTIGAVILFVSYYVFALPVGISLMFTTPLRVTGLWLGFILGLAVQNISLFYFIFSLDWEDEANDAQIRAGMVADNPQIRQALQSSLNSSGPHSVSQSTETTDLLSCNFYQPRADDLIGTYCYQSLSSLSAEAESLGSDVMHPPRKVLIRRLAVLTVVLLLMAVGVTCRLTIPVQNTGTNGTISPETSDAGLLEAGSSAEKWQPRCVLCGI